MWSGQKELARNIGVDVDNVPDPPYTPAGECVGVAMCSVMLGVIYDMNVAVNSL